MLDPENLVNECAIVQRRAAGAESTAWQVFAARLIVASFVVTFCWALPKIYRAVPTMIERASKSWETLRSENHYHYRCLSAAIAEVCKKVPPDGIVQVTVKIEGPWQYELPYYLVPRRVFVSDAPGLQRLDSPACPVWNLTLGNIVSDRHDFQLVRCAKGGPITGK